MRLLSFKLVLVAASLSLSTGSALANCGKVTITEMNWASAAIVTAVSKFLMTQGYGCDVTTIPSSAQPAVTSVAETGQPDIVTELFINSAPAYAGLETAGKVKTLTDVLSDGASGGWWIPKYLADAHPELKKLEGILANPALVGGRFNNCPNGWGCRIVGDNLIKAWNMPERGMVIFNHGSGETLAASIAAAFKDKAPWFGYYWSPTPVMAKFPMVQVDMGPYVKSVHDCNMRRECATPGKSGYPRDRVITAVTTTFASREPAASALMAKVAFTNEQMLDLIAWREANKATADETAVYFLTKYKSVWTTWLNDDARKKLANLLR